MEALRTIRLDASDGKRFTLALFDTYQTRGGKCQLAYTLTSDDGTEIFTGSDFCASPLHSIDSDETLRSLLGFLTLRPGDVEPEYFEDYDPQQIEWRDAYAEEFSILSVEPEAGFEAIPLVDVEPGF